MQSRKTLSIILSVVFFACAVSFAAVCIYIFSVSLSIAALLQSPTIDYILISALLCLASAITLLLFSGRKIRPVAIAICSAGALFLAVPNLYYYSSVFFSSKTEAQGYIYLLLMFLALVISFIAGICSCVFAFSLQRHLAKEAKPELPAEAPAEAGEPTGEEQQ